MDIYEAVTSRRAVRGYIGRQVPRQLLERVLRAAAWSPSASNLQPWHVYVLTGAPLAELKKRAGGRVAGCEPWDEAEYEMYPPALKSPYRERRSAFGEQRYGDLGIAREDLEARQRAAAANWDCFGAPAALFCYIDRDLGPPQWADVGMYLQTVMLLLRAEGLHSCAQMAWAKYHRTVAEVLSPPDGLVLFCGMSIGFEDVTVRHTRTGRAPLDETVTFVGEPAAEHLAGLPAAAPQQGDPRADGRHRKNGTTEPCIFKHPPRPVPSTRPSPSSCNTGHAFSESPIACSAVRPMPKTWSRKCGCDGRRPTAPRW